ncbi:hydroxysteroid (20-beta) dehydrogenase 2 isoform X4 [Syngnathoides biaculeatus]|uniref:hydroxysteroid (20-beta) dehydrogenase 2 isoform X4 n=1 Tax=Syngnathoides biaculeatus TaxID=300417 RepID=UPI002ADDD745|nr:hydroxysteroid (20-beta) dehydrogenase 2 isoform X4 [Syngnathoides biaculeatus]
MLPRIPRVHLVGVLAGGSEDLRPVGSRHRSHVWHRESVRDGAGEEGRGRGSGEPMRREASTSGPRDRASARSQDPQHPGGLHARPRHLPRHRPPTARPGDRNSGYVFGLGSPSILSSAPLTPACCRHQKITEVLNCNTLSVAQTTRLVLPGMLDRRSGLIVNISSQAGIHPQPLLALYSATKAFVTYFSQCLHAEYKADGITVQCVAPFLVSTNMTKMKSGVCVKSAAAFAREALNTVGYASHTNGCLLHALQSFAVGVLLPDCLRMSSFLVARMRRTAQRRKVQRGAW